MLDSIRKKLGERQLAKTFSKKNNEPKSINLHNLANVAILYIADEESDFHLVKNYITKLMHEKKAKNMMAIGFSSKKENLLFLNENKMFKFFCPNDLNWFFKPNPQTIEELIKIDFDLIIDLSPKDCLPLKHILTALKAKVKIGPDEQGTAPYYDLIIKMANTNPKEILDEANKYLTLFCHKEEAI